LGKGVEGGAFGGVPVFAGFYGIKPVTIGVCILGVGNPERGCAIGCRSCGGTGEDKEEKGK
jgi:hypothetical protein